ncbi:hypothetical protein PROFUN_03724 [Planoprotostelium fungivorum]|uniref:RRM domain-containing protein n=1 Tax=Planoprotostelium fungivorum TaxID=1890364 RepID=A0A2P6NDJ3_9EUKA|nr:hypothetical protein PROFUN_03724 [Planoprotostelium fungivorum]
MMVPMVESMEDTLLEDNILIVDVMITVTTAETIEETTAGPERIGIPQEIETTGTERGTETEIETEITVAEESPEVKSERVEEEPRRERKKKSKWDEPPAGFGGILPAAETPAATAALHLQRQSRRLYVGNIPPNIVEAELSEFFNTALYAAGVTKDGSNAPIATVQFNRDKGFAFLDFHHPEDATAGMSFDGITLHNYALKVRRPRDFKTEEEAAAAAAMEGETKPVVDTTTLRNPAAMNFLNLGMPIPAAAALCQLNIKDEPHSTRILQLFNVASIAELQDDDIYEFTLNDISTEVRKFGNVKSVYMVKPPKPDPEGKPPANHTWAVSRAFVEYSTKEEARKAHEALGGRKYNSRTILVGFYDEEKYAKLQFMPNAEEEIAYGERLREKMKVLNANSGFDGRERRRDRD